jgi:hypothetical protein
MSTGGLRETAGYNQHGDLNVRNIMAGEDGQIHLIDLARFGQWPIGYDLVRLELQCMLRLVDGGGVRAVFGDRLGEWVRLWHDLESGRLTERKNFPGGSGAQWDPGRWLLHEIGVRREEVVHAAGEVFAGTELRRIVGLLRTYDAIKMCSYQDASWFKRLRFLLIALEEAGRSGLLS